MSQRVAGPVFNSSSGTRSPEHLAAIGRRHSATVRSVWHEPSREIRPYLHKSAPCTLRFDCLNSDQTAFQIDFRPIQALEFGASQSSKSGDPDKRNEIGIRSLQQLCSFGHG